MSESSTFQNLIRGLLAGEEGAAAELLRQYEGDIRRLARARMADRRLRPYLDSADICQSVLARFFARMAERPYRLEHPAQLVGLLAKIIEHKVKDEVKRLGRKRRQHAAAGRADEMDIPDEAPTPSEQATAEELLREVHRRLSGKERHLAELWAQGRPWEEIAQVFGAEQDALRKRLSRAFRRVARELEGRGNSP